MIQTIDYPYGAAITAEILSRYRPIAPRPEDSTTNSAAEKLALYQQIAPTNNSSAEKSARYRPIAPKPVASTTNSAVENDDSDLPSGIRKSPYLSSVWADLQSMPTRARKRGHSAAFPPPPIKRTRTYLNALSQPYLATNSPAKNLAMHGFAHTANGMISPPIPLFTNYASMNCSLDTAVTRLAQSVVLPLIYCPSLHPIFRSRNGLDLNMTAEQPQSVEQQQPVELHLLPHEPVKSSVISPRPVRPVSSSITIKSIKADPCRRTVVKTAEEVEDALETDLLPAIVSDSNNKVRICNLAYKEMVGQPECCWLDCAVGMRLSKGGSACKRIGGEVLLRFVDPKPLTAAFTCVVQIEWEREGKKFIVNAACSGSKLACDGKDYQFLWRFHIKY